MPERNGFQLSCLGSMRSPVLCFVFSKSELRIMDLFLEMFLEVGEKRLGKFIDMRSDAVV